MLDEKEKETFFLYFVHFNLVGGRGKEFWWVLHERVMITPISKSNKKNNHSRKCEGAKNMKKERKN